MFPDSVLFDTGSDTMKHLWKRASGFVFQFHVPKRLSSRLGTSPFRVNLGPLSGFEAKRTARILAGHLALVIESADMDRDVVSRSLVALAKQLDDLRKQEFREQFRAVPRFPEFEDPHLDAIDEKRRIKHLAKKEALQEVRENLETIGQAISADGVAWETERSIFKNLMERFESLPVQTAPVPVPATGKPLLSEMIAPYLASKKEAEVSQKYLDGLPRRLKTFIDFAGDRPLDDYRHSEITSYGVALSKVPHTWTRDPKTAGLDIHKAVKWNEKKKLPTLSQKTIKDVYVASVKGLFRWACAEHKVLNPFQGVAFSAPRSATKMPPRQSFTVDEMNAIFSIAGKEERADDRFFPILGFLTGARLAELTSLQKRDIKQTPEGHYYIDLSETILVRGKETERAVKTEQSVRRIALHDIFRDIGFIKHVKSIKNADGWIFLDLHRAKIVRPSDAASKRMNTIIRKSGVYQRYVKVFHSFRHTAASFYKRDLRMEEMLIRRHMGHLAEDERDTSSASIYGNEPLKDHEIARLATAPLPEGLAIRELYSNQAVPS